jgi:hypothetical protein
MWAPTASKSGVAISHWTAMKMVRIGDVVLHYANGQIRAVSQATHRATEAPRPASLPDELWEQNGWLLSVNMADLLRPIQRDEIPPPMRLEQKQSMFTAHGKVNQGYLFQVDLDWYARFTRIFADCLVGTIAAEATIPAEITDGAETLLRDLIGQELRTLVGKVNKSRKCAAGKLWSPPTARRMVSTCPSLKYKLHWTHCSATVLSCVGQTMLATEVLLLAQSYEPCREPR